MGDGRTWGKNAPTISPNLSRVSPSRQPNAPQSRDAASRTTDDVASGGPRHPMLAHAALVENRRAPGDGVSPALDKVHVSLPAVAGGSCPIMLRQAAAVRARLPSVKKYFPRRQNFFPAPRSYFMPLLFFDVPILRSPSVPPIRFKTLGFFIIPRFPAPVIVFIKSLFWRMIRHG